MDQPGQYKGHARAYNALLNIIGDPPRPSLSLAEVACRQLGFSAGALATTPARFFWHPTAYEKLENAFLPQNVLCNGTEGTLAECDQVLCVAAFFAFPACYNFICCNQSTQTSTYNCYRNHLEVGVICNNGTQDKPFLRVWKNGGPNSEQGFPYVGLKNATDDQWIFGGVCDEDGFFGLREANVICRLLGYPLGAREPLKGEYVLPSRKFGNVVAATNLSCPTGNETDIGQCTFIQSSTCGDRDWAKVKCAGI